MTKRYQLRSTLGCRDSRDPRDFQRVAFGGFVPSKSVQRSGLHADETPSRAERQVEASRSRRPSPRGPSSKWESAGFFRHGSLGAPELTDVAPCSTTSEPGARATAASAPRQHASHLSGSLLQFRLAARPKSSCRDHRPISPEPSQWIASTAARRPASSLAPAENVPTVASRRTGAQASRKHR